MLKEAIIISKIILNGNIMVDGSIRYVMKLYI